MQTVPSLCALNQTPGAKHSVRETDCQQVIFLRFHFSRPDRQAVTTQTVWIPSATFPLCYVTEFHTSLISLEWSHVSLFFSAWPTACSLRPKERGTHYENDHPHSNLVG